MRRLDPAEAAAWTSVARTVRPLRAAISSPLPFRGGDGGGAVKPLQTTQSSRPDFPTPTPPLKGRGLSNTLDASWDKTLTTGRAIPDWTIDLHGHTLASAHARLDHSLATAIKNGARLVLLITGRPARDNPRLPPTSRGIIRASIADWLAASPHSAKIAAVRNAHPRHGGAGALYVVLRRARPR